MRQLWLATLLLAAGRCFDAAAQPFPPLPAPMACVARNSAASADPRLAEKVAAAERAVASTAAGAWPALADLAQFACSVTGDRLPVDAAFRRCIRDCAEERDRYFARLIYAQTLERFDDVLGAENQYLQALLSRDDPQNAYQAYMLYATMLERHERTRDALDVLNRFAGDWSYRSPPLQVKLRLMRSLGMDTTAEEEAAQRRSDADLVRTRFDSPPLSAIPVERNPLAQAAFGRTIEVVGNAWLVPAAEAGAPVPGRLVYRRAGGPDREALTATVALEPGQRFVAVVDLGPTGCRVAVDGARYDLDDCPWRSGRADAYLFRVVDERTPLEAPLKIEPVPPVPSR